MKEYKEQAEAELSGKKIKRPVSLQKINNNKHFKDEPSDDNKTSKFVGASKKKSSKVVISDQWDKLDLYA